MDTDGKDFWKEILLLFAFKNKPLSEMVLKGEQIKDLLEQWEVKNMTDMAHMNAAIEKFSDLNVLLQQRHESLVFHRGQYSKEFGNRYGIANLFNLVEASYNKHIIAEMKKLIEKYNDDGTRKEEHL